MDHHIHNVLWSWACRRHPGKSASWIKKKYFRSQGLRNWILFAKTTKDDETDNYVDLFKAGSVAIRRHIKIKAEATPYDPRFTKYFSKRHLKVAADTRESENALKTLKLLPTPTPKYVHATAGFFSTTPMDADDTTSLSNLFF